MSPLIEFGDPIEFELPVAALPLEPLRNPIFKVYVLETAHDQMLRHVEERLDVESGGILVGYPFRADDKSTTFVVIVGIVPNQSDNRSSVHFTVSAEEARAARTFIEDRYTGLMPVGWYHSHPGLGVFLSGQDMTIVRSIYNLPWNIAWVIDPKRRTEGIFLGPEGRPIVEGRRELPLEQRAWIALPDVPQCIRDLSVPAESPRSELPRPEFTVERRLSPRRATDAATQGPAPQRRKHRIGDDFITTLLYAILWLLVVIAVLAFALSWWGGDLQGLFPLAPTAYQPYRTVGVTPALLPPAQTFIVPSGTGTSTLSATSTPFGPVFSLTSSPASGITPMLPAAPGTELPPRIP